ncbi:DASS family sodium-coupled anion symporter [Leptospira sp. 2 VSF19]|uniref:DASS family sodium-coupled anion symporter n=1 Tax=Leptospira soteropolitanensis TaxID=2950025 RepID=A0AAW5VG04_9LEPT|nr:DASS family sodium-coupled anion symporter [Leptospira soteropolitanensis]MCW7491766.1 DASS family sodium-coupled anion symporter [Leptospira soteropolitanensis]MCW7499351.1 DASS family sodium-coupled anion symporter [Leptospira soteropolitanensis]MCW7521058.1 DASS family sodium-coupled anion symporter [Leptospira soteropolitanensis]MCW7525454.1 DASS family sodium-coupled anion symporter [Leptospira soteropolitanensis]MCW7529321.1 DASS family sodium-coupled anion symporter [Leptospira soter
MIRAGIVFLSLSIIPALFGWYQMWLGLSGPQEVNLAIALVVSFLWVTELFPLYVTGFLVLFLELVWLLPTWGPGAPKTITFLSCYFSETILLFLGGFVISSAITFYGLDSSIARFVIQKTKGSAFLLVLSLGFATAFLSCFMNNTATAAMMLGLVSSMMKSLEESNPLRKSLLFMVPFSANLGGIGTPVGTLPNVIGIGYLQERGLEFGFLNWMGFAFPVFILSVLALAILLYIVYLKKDKSRNSVFAIQVSNVDDSLSKRNRSIALGIILITILGWITSDWHGISNGTVALLPVIIFFGFRLLDLKEFRNLSWDVLILMGGGIALGKAFEETGLAKHFVEVFMLGDSGQFGLFLFFSILSLGLSCFLSNTSVANLVLPITMGLPTHLILPAAIGATIGASLAMPLPVSTPPNALAFSYGGIRSLEMLKVGGIISVIAWTFFVSIGGFMLHILGIVDFSKF